MKNKSDETRHKIDLTIKIILVIIIILLLIHNCKLVKDKDYMSNVPNGNVDIIDIKCDDGKCKPTITPTPVLPKEIDSISFNTKNISIKKGDSLKLITIIKPTELSGQKLSWKSSNLKVATVDKNGVIKGISEGEATITVTTSNGKKATCTVKVVNKEINVKEIKLSIDDSNIVVGSSEQMIATIQPSDATNRELVWLSSDSSVATVDSSGVIKGVKSGKVIITAKTKDGKVVASKEITIKDIPVTPTPTPKEIESLNFTNKNISVEKGDTLGLIVEIKPIELKDEKLSWKSSDSSVVTVDSNGVIKGVSEGEATITVTSSNGKKATCIVKVTTKEIPVEDITISVSEDSVEVGDMIQLKATIIPSDATNRELVWSSSDPSIATVDSKGVVRGIKNGKVTITVKTKDGKVVATCEITVDPVSDDSLDVYDNDHTPITWNGSNDLKIFSKSLYNIDGVIAPESENTYEFVVRNSTKYDIKYSINFIETNISQINMKYKLRKNDTYLVDQYSSFNELNLEDQLLSSGEKDTFYLEWKWISSSNDTDIGKNPESKYGLKIQIEAENIHG